MIEQFVPYLVMVCIVFGGVCAVVTTRNITRSAPISTKIKRQYDLYISDLESSNKRLNGKLNQMNKKISIDPESADDPFSAIGSIIDQIAPQLPAGIRPLLKNKKAVDFISNYVQQNPEAVKQLVEKFTSKPGAKSAPATQESTL
ncbi:MAG: hypothetical protein [Circular genetic element sp.]|nr:MAG: hypothetical protein [Circular genetic element sp.]